ncbi:DUF6907 domain-containing protein [Streptomyces syringium]|uniref:DUF6907 domain-containing protein n=1 Tax=Streptomyces syringium TaxID=76729 RepID=UPI0036E1A807
MSQSTVTVPEIATTRLGRLPYVIASPTPTAVADSRPTAEQRGTEWMARYGCPIWCRMDHAGDDGAPGWHNGPEASVTCPTRGLNAEDDEGGDVLLAARVVHTNEDAEHYGTETRIWFDYGLDTTELNVEQVDQLITKLTIFLPQLHAMRKHLAAVIVNDVPRPNTAAKDAR